MQLRRGPATVSVEQGYVIHCVHSWEGVALAMKRKPGDLPICLGITSFEEKDLNEEQEYILLHHVE